MKIVCPACETGYQVADGTLGVTGRKVRCARCGTVWHATPNDYPEAPIAVVPTPKSPGGGPEPSEDEWRTAIVGDGPESVFDEDAPADEAASGNDQSAIDDMFASGPTEDETTEDAGDDNDQSAIDDMFASGPTEDEATEDAGGGNGQSAVDDLFATEPAGDTVAKTEDDDEPRVVEAEGAPTIDVPPAGFEGRRRKTRGKKGRKGASTFVKIDQRLSTPVASGLLISFLVLFCVAAVVGRERIVATFPDFAGIYELIGLKVNLRGLDFQNVAAHQEMDGSTPVLLVDGDIVNLDGESKGLPAIRVTLKSSTGRDVYAWNYTLPQLNIDQMGKVHFKTRLLAPPEASVTVEVRFTDQRQP